MKGAKDFPDRRSGSGKKGTVLLHPKPPPGPAYLTTLLTDTPCRKWFLAIIWFYGSQGGKSQQGRAFFHLTLAMFWGHHGSLGMPRGRGPAYRCPVLVQPLQGCKANFFFYYYYFGIFFLSWDSEKTGPPL